ncbi:flavodoxin domain-containing protein [candidate division WOR-3 bacterium]|nr:flavodoxin domain-containing protein [candidate division WOR-3 bacterium]
MNLPFKAVKISENVYWVGAVDWGIRDFHGYATRRGTTYNAYLVTAEKPALIDTVKAPFFAEMMSRIRSVIEPDKIEIIVSNHSEMDHSGSLIQTIDALKPEKVFASVMGVKALAEHFHHSRDIQAVKTGDKIDLGNMSLSAVETRMVHWPDSMMTYLDRDKLLFSQDGFGMHMASTERFADQLPESLLYAEAAKYYSNILLLYTQTIAQALDSVQGLGVPINYVCPDHGPVWRKPEQISWIIGNYVKWAEQKPVDKAVIVYDTMWHTTQHMADAIADGVRESGCRAKVLPLSGAHRSDIATEILEAGALIVGSPTINNQMFPSLADALTYLKGLKPRNLLGGVFGSFGWSGEACKHLTAYLTDMGIEIAAEPLRVKYVADDSMLAQAHQWGAEIGMKLLKRL